MLDLLLRNAHVYAPEDLGIVSVGISDGTIAYIGKDATQARRVIDCEGRNLLPGAIETHAHMLLPFGGTQTMNDFYDGTMSGAIGGVTTLIDFADQTHGHSVRSALEERLELAKECVTDYSFHCTITDLEAGALSEIPGLVRDGFTSFKFYTAYSASGLYLPEKEMTEAFRAVAEAGALATVHAETEREVLDATERLIREGKTAISYFSESRPDESEKSAIENVIRIAGKTGAKLLIRHVTSTAGVELIQKAQEKGQTVIGETCPHYLMLTRDVYLGEHGSDYICNPPIRGETDRQSLWNAVSGGAKFVIGTDDCGFYLSQKRVSDRFDRIPGGMPGIETRTPIMLSEGPGKGRFGYERLAHILSTDVAKMYGIYPKKGVIRVGSDADLFLEEPCAPYALTASMLHEKTDYTPFEGLMLDRKVGMTVSRGEIIAEHNTFTGERKRGRLLFRGLPGSIAEL